MRRVLLFVNPVFDQRASDRAAISRVAELLRSSGAAVETVESLSPQSAGDQVRQGIEDGCDAILVCGGDGTVFNVIQGVAGSDVPVGILPFGTGNVLAQNLNLTRDPMKAAQLLMRAAPRRIPLGRITVSVPDLGGPEDAIALRKREKSWYFAMAAGMGWHASLMSATEGSGKRTLGRASYFLAAVNLLMRDRIQPFEVEVTTVAGGKFSQTVCEALAVRVAELNRWRPGGSLEQPTLRLATVEATGRLGLAAASFQAIARLPSRNGNKPKIRYTDALRIVCRPVPNYAYNGAVLVEADGEVLGASHAVIEMAKESFCLLWP